MSDSFTEVTASDVSHLTQNSPNELLQQLQEQLRSQQEFFNQQREVYLQELLNQQHQQQQNVQLSKKPLTDSSQSTHWSFTQGLVVGQLSVIFIIIVFIKFFVFADSATLPSKTILRDASGVIVKRDSLSSKPNNTTNSYLNSQQVDSLVEDEKMLNNKAKVTKILEKTYYDVNNHSSESLDWFNVLIAQTISHLRTEALLSDNIYHSLNDFLSETDMPEFMDRIKLTEIDVGDDFPIFSNCRIKQNDQKNNHRLEAKIDVDLSDTLTLGIETRLLLNHPRPLTAILPVSLTVSIVRFSGCLTVSFINTNDQEFVNTNTTKTQQQEPQHNSSSDEDNDGNNNNTGAGTALMFSFSPDYRLEFVVKSLIGSRAKLQDVPKISSLVENRLKTWFVERCVEPRFQVVRLPSLWPRTKNTREPSTMNSNDDGNEEHS
ncbi:MMM1 [Candida pseudojiufengensis]|uniref:MMM1 n=1 Tax=Candida pseudojiufengensis TaxID=497109 RepID=UPI00222465C3|nr:MMM1 [Candida pseudojiufengensis]KAI5965538.1 MMM1 [Candida pseudojiufengensis]